jgi:hypothetical protein
MLTMIFRALSMTVVVTVIIIVLLSSVVSSVAFVISTPAEWYSVYGNGSIYKATCPLERPVYVPDQLTYWDVSYEETEDYRRYNKAQDDLQKQIKQWEASIAAYNDNMKRYRECMGDVGRWLDVHYANTQLGRGAVWKWTRRTWQFD